MNYYIFEAKMDTLSREFRFRQCNIKNEKLIHLLRG